MGEAGGGARDTAGGGADVEGLRRLVEIDVDRQQLGAPLDPAQARSLDEEVDQDVFGAVVDQHEAAGTEPGQRALGGE